MLLVSPTNRTIGLDFSEYDIWWLINYKKFMSNESRILFYEIDISPKKSLLVKAYDIETPNIYIDEDKGDMKYIEY